MLTPEDDRRIFGSAALRDGQRAAVDNLSPVRAGDITYGFTRTPREGNDMRVRKMTRTEWDAEMRHLMVDEQKAVEALLSVMVARERMRMAGEQEGWIE